MIGKLRKKEGSMMIGEEGGIIHYKRKKEG